MSPKQRRTPLGRRLDEIRTRIKASGVPLLSWEDIDRERERGGELAEQAEKARRRKVQE